MMIMVEREDWLYCQTNTLLKNIVWRNPACFISLCFASFRRESCNKGEGDPPLYVNVNMFSGEIMNTWIDSLQAFFPGLQVR